MARINADNYKLIHIVHENILSEVKSFAQLADNWNIAAEDDFDELSDAILNDILELFNGRDDDE